MGLKVLIKKILYLIQIDRVSLTNIVVQKCVIWDHVFYECVYGILVLSYVCWVPYISIGTLSHTNKAYQKKKKPQQINTMTAKKKYSQLVVMAQSAQ